MTPFEILFKIGSRFPSLSLQSVYLHCAPQCLKAIFGIDPWPKYLTPSSMLLVRQWISLASLCSWLVGPNTRSLKSRMPLPSSISCEQLPGRRVRLAKDGKSPIVHAGQTRRSGPTFIRLWKLPMIELSKEALLISIPCTLLNISGEASCNSAILFLNPGSNGVRMSRYNCRGQDRNRKPFVRMACSCHILMQVSVYFDSWSQILSSLPRLQTPVPYCHFFRPLQWADRSLMIVVERGLWHNSRA